MTSEVMDDKDWLPEHETLTLAEFWQAAALEMLLALTLASVLALLSGWSMWWFWWLIPSAWNGWSLWRCQRISLAAAEGWQCLDHNDQPLARHWQLVCLALWLGSWQLLWWWLGPLLCLALAGLLWLLALGSHWLDVPLAWRGRRWVRHDAIATPLQLFAPLLAARWQQVQQPHWQLGLLMLLGASGMMHVALPAYHSYAAQEVQQAMRHGAQHFPRVLDTYRERHRSWPQSLQQAGLDGRVNGVEYGAQIDVQWQPQAPRLLLSGSRAWPAQLELRALSPGQWQCRVLYQPPGPLPQPGLPLCP